MSVPIVVKLGGSCLEDMTDVWWDDLAGRAESRLLVLVHGWSKPLRRLRPRYGDPSAVLRDRYGNQSRWTTPEVITDIRTVSAVLAAEVTDRLVRRGIELTRLVGSDGLLHAGTGERWWWRGKELVELSNLVGPISEVDRRALTAAGLAPGHAVLVTPLARNAEDQVVNTDADRAAAALAGETAATALALVTDVPFVLIDGSPARRLDVAAAAAFRDNGAVGGMRKKLRAATEALEHGVPRVLIGNAPISELLAERSGTVITRSREVLPT